MVHCTVLLLKRAVKYTSKWLFRSLGVLPKCALIPAPFICTWYLSDICYLGRYNVKDSSRHIILGTQQFKPVEFGQQINLSMDNAWGIVRWVLVLVLLGFLGTQGMVLLLLFLEIHQWCITKTSDDAVEACVGAGVAGAPPRQVRPGPGDGPEGRQVSARQGSQQGHDQVGVNLTPRTPSTCHLTPYTPHNLNLPPATLNTPYTPLTPLKPLTLQACHLTPDPPGCTTFPIPPLRATRTRTVTVRKVGPECLGDWGIFRWEII